MKVFRQTHIICWSKSACKWKEEEDAHECGPSNGYCADDDRISSQMKRSGNETLSARSNAQQNRHRIRCIQTDNGGANRTLSDYEMSRKLNCYPAREENAVFENVSRPTIAERPMISHTALTGAFVRGLICFHQREPGRPLSRASAKVTREASTPCATPLTHWPLLLGKQQKNKITTYLNGNDHTPNS